MDAVILAGGKGTRLGKLAQKTPKSLIKINGKPLLEYQIELLLSYKIKNIYILAGFLGEKIDKYIKSRRWISNIKTIIESKPLGTAGALKQIEAIIRGNFIAVSGDVFLDIDLKKLFKFHMQNKGATSTIVVHPNDHPIDSDLVKVEENYKVNKFLLRKKKKQPENLIFRNLANAGVFVFSPKIFRHIKKNNYSDLEKDLLNKILDSGESIYAYKTPEYIRDMGTPKRLARVRRDFKNKLPVKMNLNKKQAAVFLDRDGTLNRKDGDYDVKLSQFELYRNSAKAIKKINKLGMLSIVITNQPAIAKGFLTEHEVNLIHKKLETELGKNGAWLDAIYYCPHHPEKGFKGEIKALKIKCNCRKPGIGLIKKASMEYNIDLSKSYYIGDSTSDAKCAEKAKIKFIGVSTGQSMSDGRYKLSKNIKIVENVLKAVNTIPAEI